MGLHLKGEVVSEGSHYCKRGLQIESLPSSGKKRRKISRRDDRLLAGGAYPKEQEEFQFVMRHVELRDVVRIHEVVHDGGLAKVFSNSMQNETQSE